MAITENPIQAKLLDGVGNLRPLPASVLRLMKLAEDVDSDLDEIVDIIAHDPSLTMEVLRIANSAAYAVSGGSATVQESVNILGLSQIITIAFSFSLGPTLRAAAPEFELAQGQLFRHAILSSLSAESIAAGAQLDVPPEALPAALMHDIGKVIICQFAPEHARNLFLEAQRAGGMSRLAAEQEIFSANHAELGCLLGQRWQIPERICHAIQYHHEPELGRDPLCDVVHLANLMAKRADAEVEAEEKDLAWAPEVVLRLGLSEDKLQRQVEGVRTRFEKIRPLYSL